MYQFPNRSLCERLTGFMTWQAQIYEKSGESGRERGPRQGHCVAIAEYPIDFTLWPDTWVQSDPIIPSSSPCYWERVDKSSLSWLI